MDVTMIPNASEEAFYSLLKNLGNCDSLFVLHKCSLYVFPEFLKVEEKLLMMH